MYTTKNTLLTKQLKKNLGKWLIAFIVFVMTMTLNVSEAEGVQIASEPSQRTAETTTTVESAQVLNQILPTSLDPTNPSDPGTSAVPEASTLLILSIGLIGLQANRLIKLHQE